MNPLAIYLAKLPTLKLASRIGIDETKVRWKRKGRYVYVWVALDLERREVLEVMVSLRRRWEYASHSYEKFGMRSFVERVFRYEGEAKKQLSIEERELAILGRK